jgi:hypothetical protein
MLRLDNRGQQYGSDVCEIRFSTKKVHLIGWAFFIGIASGRLSFKVGSPTWQELEDNFQSALNLTSASSSVVLADLRG